MRRNEGIGTVWRTEMGDIFRVARVEDHRILMDPIETHGGYIYDDDGTIPFSEILDEWKPVEVMEF